MAHSLKFRNQVEAWKRDKLVCAQCGSTYFEIDNLGHQQCYKAVPFVKPTSDGGVQETLYVGQDHAPTIRGPGIRKFDSVCLDAIKQVAGIPDQSIRKVSSPIEGMTTSEFYEISRTDSASESYIRRWSGSRMSLTDLSLSRTAYSKKDGKLIRVMKYVIRR